MRDNNYPNKSRTAKEATEDISIFFKRKFLDFSGNDLSGTGQVSGRDKSFPEKFRKLQNGVSKNGNLT